MSVQSASRKSVRFRGRSYLAYMLTPEPPVYDWLADLNGWISQAPGYFVGKPVILDLSAVTLSASAIVQLLDELLARGIRIMGLEGVDPREVGPDLPPVLVGGRPVAIAEPQESASAAAPQESAPQEPVPYIEAAAQPEPATLLLETPVRSGQSIVFPHGDITVLGSVASGAEVIAGGSIHIYGTLRGRAFAGSHGNERARIFCSKVEAELLAISGFYRTADDIEAKLRSQPIQAWLKGDVMFIAPLN
ncbi:MAG: septum site-determining protein MinC [Xanthobacteraceae bacterium]|nr:septum site-determining protein MinC [Xanthobacteraceae bacterium]